jgi:Stage II sporulation protein E (SpoIIE)
VSGHGVPAALIASLVKVALAAQRDHAESPAAVLAGMNTTLCGRLAGQYVTAAPVHRHPRRSDSLRRGGPSADASVKSSQWKRPPDDDLTIVLVDWKGSTSTTPGRYDGG